jgi:hypothetical protein
MIRNRLKPVLASVLLGLVTCVTAFAAPKQPFLRTTSTTTRTTFRAGAQDDDNPINNDVTELTSALARLDKQWKIQLGSKNAKKSRWTKLVLPKDPNEEVVEERPEATTDPTAVPKDFVWLLEPPNSSIPSCIIVFTGGAGLGQFPNIAYSQFLTRISNRLNAAVLTAPYSVGLDHFSLAKQTGEGLRRALLYCEDDPARQYSSNIPTYSLSHSLGGKLQTIYMGATGQDFDGIGLVSFNNFSFGQTVKMGRMFAEQIRKSRGQQIPNMKNPFENEQILNTIFEFAEMAVGAIGVDFSPNADDTERLIQLKYDNVLQSKTRLFVFDDDKLDSSKEFIENCSGGPGPSASGLPGGHLTPVYFKLDFDDVGMDGVPEEARVMAKEAMGGFQSATFGDEPHLDELVDEVCDWILGKGPKRPPEWEKARQGPPLIAGSASPKQ